MGSLAPVKVLSEKSPTEITKNLLKDISSKSQSATSATMGGLFSLPAPSIPANIPPESLSKLLEEILKENAKKKEVLTSKTVDTIIAGSRWGKEFRAYLESPLYIAILRWVLQTADFPVG